MNDSKRQFFLASKSFDNSNRASGAKKSRSGMNPECCNYKSLLRTHFAYHCHWVASFAGLGAYLYGIRLPLIGQAMCEHSAPGLIFSLAVSLLLFHYCLWPDTLTRPSTPFILVYYAVAAIIIMNLSHLLVWQTCLLLLRLLLRGAAQGLSKLNDMAALGKGSFADASSEALLEQAKKSTLPLGLSFLLLAWAIHAIGWLDPNSCFSPQMLFRQIQTTSHGKSRHNISRSSSRNRNKRRRNYSIDNIVFDDD